MLKKLYQKQKIIGENMEMKMEDILFYNLLTTINSVYSLDNGEDLLDLDEDESIVNDLEETIENLVDFFSELSLGERLLFEYKANAFLSVVIPSYRLNIDSCYQHYIIANKDLAYIIKLIYS